MPELVCYRERERVPLLDWLEELGPVAAASCIDQLRRLAARGHELRRPHAAHLGEGIHELRVRWRRLNLRILYFFHGRAVVVVTHGFAKQRSKVPEEEVRRARERRERFHADPEHHSWSLEA